MEAYNCEELLSVGYGTETSLEGVYVSLLQLNKILPENYWDSDNESSYFSERQLEYLLKDNEISIEFV